MMSKAQQDTDTKMPKERAVIAAEKTETVVTAPGDTRVKNQSAAKIAGGIAVAAIVIAIAALGIAYKISTEQNTLSQRINNTEKSLSGIESISASNRSLTETAQSTSQSLMNQLNVMKTDIDALDEKLGSSVDTLLQTDTSINDALEVLRNSLRSNKDDGLLVAEALHLINIANHQAQLNHNSASAAAALEAADQRLRDAADPALLETRQIITADIIALRNIGNIDIDGIALTLSQLEDSIDGLPLKHETRKSADITNSGATTEVTDASSFFNKIWSDIKGLVSVRHNSGEHNSALLPPGQHFFLQQNLRLKLETARLALLQGDSQIFQTSLNTAQQWVETYFDTTAAGPANLLSSIAPYQTLELRPALPDLSRSLKTLKTWSKMQDTEVGAS